MTAVIRGVASLDFGNFEDNEIDLFGDAYEFLIFNYAANAGKSGGILFPIECFKVDSTACFVGTNLRKQDLRPCLWFWFAVASSQEVV
ncbi:MAG: N-6 DNA methylase [Bacteroidales bacterium]